MVKVVMISLTLVMLTGCWDRHEINDMAFVSGTAIDYRDDDKYLVSVQIALPGQMGGTGSQGGGGGTNGDKPWYVESQVANTIYDANALEQTRISRKLNYAHRRMLIFGEDMAKSGLIRAIDVFTRTPQNRLTAYVVVAKGSAQKVLATEVPIEQSSSEMIRELVNFTTKTPQSLKVLANLMLTDGIDPTLPVVTIKDLPAASGETKPTLQLSGVAIFNQENKLVSIMEGEDATFLLWAMDEAKTPDLVVDPPKGKGELSLRFTETQTEIKPRFAGDKITMDILIQAKGEVIENESDFDIVEEQHVAQVERIAEQKVQQGIEKITKKLQQEYKSDPLGFGQKIYLWNPKKWKEVKGQWDVIYPQVQVNVQTNIHIEHSGTLADPFGVKERNQHD